MKIKIDEKKCLGCGSCFALAPDYFQIDPASGKARIVKQPKAKVEEVERAIESCPAQAIFRSEE